MTCSKCEYTNSPGALYCLRCGNGLNLAVLEPEPKLYTATDLARETAALKSRYEAIIADNNEKAAEAYLNVANEYSKLLAAHTELQSEMAKITELAKASAPTSTPAA